MKNFSRFDKEVSKQFLFSLSEEEFEELFKEVLKILDIYKDKYKEDFLLGEFIETDYISLLQDRFKTLKKTHGELNYDILNKDKIIRDLKKKIDDKALIQEAITHVCNKKSSYFKNKK